VRAHLKIATGFMRHFMALSLALAAGGAAAAEVTLTGMIGNKAAVLSIDGGAPKAVKVGESWNGVTVVSVQKDRATLRIDQKERILMQGQHYHSGATPSAAAASPAPPADNRTSATLAADSRGHFITDGAVNGVGMRFLVDTGATVVTLPAAEARRLGIDYRAGRRGMVQTANGIAPTYGISLDSVKVGGIELSAVDALVIEHGLDTPLLGMSFLNRVEMRRNGDTMTLIRRF
jgi:aspartyl protease family protein